MPIYTLMEIGMETLFLRGNFVTLQVGIYTMYVAGHFVPNRLNCNQTRSFCFNLGQFGAGHRSLFYQYRNNTNCLKLIQILTLALKCFVHKA